MAASSSVSTGEATIRGQVDAVLRAEPRQDGQVPHVQAWGSSTSSMRMSWGWW
ncbi:hypothetical protein [Actinomycetospora sp. NBRC 106375]|uniref:hypothetical protein n=1 Tax=Actinomycetospora sp. NBRC 106375 TaxID=3032207 RepID=UPI002554A8BD|nr:hypothetical protein [Actinomycetospora sp. NBRC 106375]